MAIRYTEDYNKFIRNTVRNFNKRRATAINKGIKEVPPIMKVSDLKARYSTRAELNKELSFLRNFKGEDALKVIETQGGATAIKWEVDYLKALVGNTKDFLNRQLFEIRQSMRKNPKIRDLAKEDMVNLLLDKRNLLDMELAQLNKEDFRVYRSTIYEYVQEHQRSGRAYRGFLNEVELVMQMTGVDSKTISKFMNKFKTLSPEEFIYLYNNSDLIARIYELADSPSLGDFKLNTGVDDARDMIDTLLEEQDMLIDSAKKEFSGIDDMLKDEYKNAKDTTKTGKGIPAETLTPDQIEQLKTLGWEDLIKW